MDVTLRLLDADHAALLREPLLELAAYHNRIPSPFVGMYPPIPVEETLKDVAAQLRDDKARVEMAFKDGDFAGFCKASIDRTVGWIDYLYVREECRGLGLGGRLIEGALAYFRARNLSLIDLKVVAGNPARRLYEKYGFQIRSHVMSRKP